MRKRYPYKSKTMKLRAWMTEYAACFVSDFSREK